MRGTFNDSNVVAKLIIPPCTKASTFNKVCLLHNGHAINLISTTIDIV
jgi:hypothetical protein